MRPGRWLVVALALAAIGIGLAPATAKDAARVVRFSHADHKGRKVDIDDCKACHKLDEGFQVEPPLTGADHKPCSNPACHESEFFSRQPTICAVCHDDPNPSVAEVAVYRHRDTSEFGGEINHKSHAGAKVTGAGKNGACKQCHGDPYRGTPAPQGHQVCAACHGKAAEPAMTACGACHKFGEVASHVGSKASAWSVRDLFAHATHGTDPRSGQSETTCVACHATVKQAVRLSQIMSPAMRTCDGCHDGKLAFKTTGFECSRCHGSKQ